jgi:hypothetical protein
LRSTGVLEYWSNGKNPFSEFSESQIYGENLEVQSSVFLRPTLQYSSTPADYYRQSLLSLTEPEGPGFPCQNKIGIIALKRYHKLVKRV